MKKQEWTRWYLVPESGSYRIKRYRTNEAGKREWQRYPAKQYKELPKPDVESLLRRLNATYEADRQLAAERYNFNYSHINRATVDKFEQFLKKRATDKNHLSFTVQLLNEYVFEFFIIQCKLPDPSRWHLKEDAWGEWLLTKDLSAATLKKIVATANRFNKFLVEKVNPEMDTPRKLEPIGKVTLDKLAGQLARETKFISDRTYQQLVNHVERVDRDVLPNIELCFNFGLRISESLGLTKAKFLKSALLVDEQGDRLHNGEVLRKPLKTKDARKVPYWNMQPKAAWELVKQIKPMHPDTLVKRVNDCMAHFGHTSHDLRRTFITNALRKYHWKDVQLAVGHKDVRTLMGYNQDDRNLTDEQADLGD